MTTTYFDHDDPRTQKVFVKDPFVYGMMKNFFFNTGMMSIGADANGIVHVNKDLLVKKGDTVQFDLYNPLIGDGVGDRQKLKEHTERLIVDSMGIQVHELGHAVEADSPISEQRTATNTEVVAQRKLMEWMSKHWEFGIRQSVCGLYNKNTDITIINEKEPSTNRIWYGGGQAAGGVKGSFANDKLLSEATEEDYLFNTDVLRMILRKINALEPQFGRVNPDGEDRLVCLLPPLMVKALEACSDYKEIHKHANIKGSKNPFFTKSIGKIKEIQLYEYPEMPIRTGAGGTTPAEGFLLNATRTTTADANATIASGASIGCGVVLGAQAAGLGVAKEPRYLLDSADMFDKNKKPRIPIIGFDSLVGITKSRFSRHDPDVGSDTAQEDFASYVFHCRVVPD